GTSPELQTQGGPGSFRSAKKNRNRGTGRPLGWNGLPMPRAAYWTTTVPCIIAPCDRQKYGNVPACVKVCENVIPVPTPEFHMPSGVQPPEQVPEVVEWNPLTQVHWTVSPTWIVV